MQKLFLILLLFSYNLFAQPNYYAFMYNNKYGITDTIGKIIVEPIYDHYTIINKNEVVLGSKNSYLKANMFTNKQLFYEYYKNNYAHINNSWYDYIVKDGKKYLENVTNYSLINIKQEYNFKGIDAKYVGGIYKKPSLSNQNDSISIVSILSNDKNLKVIFETEADDFKALYPLKSYEAKYFLFKKGKEYSIYNASFILIKKYSSIDSINKQREYCSKVLGVKFQKEIEYLQVNKLKDNQIIFEDNLYKYVDYVNPENEYLYCKNKLEFIDDDHWLNLLTVTKNDKKYQFYFSNFTKTIFYPTQFIDELDLIQPIEKVSGKQILVPQDIKDVGR